MGGISSRAIWVCGLLVLAPLLGALEAAAGCGDLSDDGTVDAVDVGIYRTSLADPAIPLSGAQKRLCVVYGAQGACDVLNLTVMRRHIFGSGLAPGISQVCSDGDLDGVPDADDGCRGTRAGATLHGRGCSTADLVRSGEALFEDFAPDLSEAAALIVASPVLQAEAMVTDLSSGIAAGVTAMQTALVSLRTGDVCGSGVGFAAGLAQIATPRNALLTELPTLTTRLAQVGVPAAGGHFGDGQLDVVVLQAGLKSLELAYDTASEIGGVFASACGAAQTPFSDTGIVASVDDATGRLELTNGSSYVLATGRTVTAYVVGEEVELNGTRTSDSTQIITSVGPTTPGSTGAHPIPCLDLRIAPLQPFGVNGYGPPVLHRFAAYENTPGTYTLEKGARLHALSFGCPNTTPNVFTPYSRYSYRIYAPGYGPLVDDLEPDDGAVALPGSLPINTPIQLTAVEQKRYCNPVLLAPCTLTDTITTVYTVILKPAGSLCSARYLDDVFKIEDQQTAMTDYRGTYLDYVQVDGSFSDGIGDPEFRGEYCLKYQNGQSCEDALDLNMKGSDPIVIWVDDFYPVHKPDNYFILSSYRRRTGMTHAGALKWPHVVGMRNGREYRYSCTAPALVRDRVSECTGTDSFYRYPLYPGGNPPWHLQNGGPEHGPGKQSHAYDVEVDVELPEKKIRAIRGGRVVLAVESSSASDAELCWDAMGSNCDFGNYLYVRHQDGTHATYWHMRQNSILPVEGEIVQRSDELADVGDTGRSYGPHVHFHVQDLNGVDSSPSIYIKFQTPTIDCAVPVPPDPMASNNDPAVFR